MDKQSPPSNEYTEVRYRQFDRGPVMSAIMSLIGILSWPVILPLALLARLSDTLFRTFSEILSMAPYFPGVILRYEFYRFALRKCGKNVVIEFGSVFLYSDVELGDNVLIGRFCIIHECDLGSNVLVGERCTFLSGSRQHRYDRVDVPMAMQGGERKRISVSDDCWVGSHAVVTEDIGTGCVIGAGSVVTKRVPDFSVAVGSPARVVRNRAAAD